MWEIFIVTLTLSSTLPLVKCHLNEILELKDFFLLKVKYYIWDNPYFYKYCLNQIITKCIPKGKTQAILKMCYDDAYGSHFTTKKINAKVVEPQSLYWNMMMKDAWNHIKSCKRCQNMGLINKRWSMPLHDILIVEVFDC